MANSPQARKRARQAEKHRQNNAGQRSRMRTFVKKTVKALDAGDVEAATAAFAAAVPVLDSVADKDVVSKNHVARQKRRLNARLKALATAS